MIIGIAIGLALALLAATGLVGMAVWAASTDKHRECEEHCVCEYP